MTDTLIHMTIALAMTCIWFFIALLTLFTIGDTWLCDLSLGLSICSMVGFIITFATQGDE